MEGVVIIIIIISRQSCLMESIKSQSHIKCRGCIKGATHGLGSPTNPASLPLSLLPRGTYHAASTIASTSFDLVMSVASNATTSFSGFRLPSTAAKHKPKANSDTFASVTPTTVGPVLLTMTYTHARTHAYT